MDFEKIPEFPRYSVSQDGLIRNDDTDRIMVLTRNQHGLVQVGLMRGGVQHKRSVALLVAQAFLDRPAIETFNTPIHLDGDRTNNRVENLMWRPRWFAYKYTQQFEKPIAITRRIQEIASKEKFKNSRRAAITYGLLEYDIMISAMQGGVVWPTYQRFRILD